MSDDDRDLDGDGMMGDESEDDEMDEDELSEKTGSFSSSSSSNKPMTQAEKRAHHNALERKRRDHIKDSFTSLRDSVPSLQGEKSSRAQILKKSAEFIQFIRRKNSSHQHDIEDLKKQNSLLESQIRAIERTKLGGFTISSPPVGTSPVLGTNLVKVKVEDEGISGRTKSKPIPVVPGGPKKIKVLSIGHSSLK